MTISDSELLLLIKEISANVSAQMSVLKPLAKVLDRIDSLDDLQRQDFLAEIESALQSSDLVKLGLDGKGSALLSEIAPRLGKLRMAAQQLLLQGLHAISSDNPPKILSDTPLVIYLHPLTLTADFEQFKANFSYAREEIQSCPLDPIEIMKTHGQILTSFRNLRVDSKTFFQRLVNAYQMVLVRNALPPQSRVDIVELIAPLSWLWDEGAGNKKSISLLPKYVLAYQIQKLRKDKLLSHNGLKLDLGVATGGSTRNKSKVLYIPNGPSEGQYYLSIAFM